MPENDTAQWTRRLKLAAVAGPIALGVFGAAFLVHGSLQLFGWGFAAGSIFLAAVTAVDAYVRRGRPDTSRAAVDERRRKMRALTAVATAIGGIGATLISVFDLP